MFDSRVLILFIPLCHHENFLHEDVSLSELQSISLDITKLDLINKVKYHSIDNRGETISFVSTSSKYSHNRVGWSLCYMNILNWSLCWLSNLPKSYSLSLFSSIFTYEFACIYVVFLWLFFLMKSLIPLTVFVLSAYYTKS